jgi:hypothetical protein
MSRSRMFGDDEPKNPSPRTTIVGGQPPGNSAELPPVPTGIQRLLRLASVDDGFRRELLARRGGLASVAEVELTASERAILQAIPAAQLEAMIGSLPPPAEDRRSFLRQTAATAVMLLGGAALSSCDNRAERRLQAPGGAAPDVPPPRPEHRETEADGGISPHLRRPEQTRDIAGATAEPPARKMAGATADPPRFAEPPPPRVDDDTRPMAGVTAPREDPDRVEHRLQAPGGAAPDVPRPRPPRDGGVDGPTRPPDTRPTRGIRPDVPRK